VNIKEKLTAKTTFEAQKYHDGVLEQCVIEVATEVPFTITVNDIEVATLFCTPENLKELVYGFLFTQGMIFSASEVQKIYIEQETWKAVVTTIKTPDMDLLGKRIFTAGCGKGIMYSGVTDLMTREPLSGGFTAKAKDITASMRDMAISSELHKATGGVHTASLSVNGVKSLFYIDDIGRHNAVDKVIGKSLIDSIDLKKTVLLSTGRVSSEILYKARKAEIPIVASLGAATHQSLLLAIKLGVTLCTFVRGDKFTLLSHPERISLC
jgi:FdhD protein